MSILGDFYDNQIKGFEGWAPRAAWDYKQHTNGWGTRATSPGEVIDKDEAQRRYDAEIQKSHDLVRQFAPDIDHGTAAALTDLTFNAGSSWMKSGLGQAIKAGDLDRARASFLQYTKAGGQDLEGLQRRRAAGIGWFGQGYQPNAPQDPEMPGLAMGLGNKPSILPGAPAVAGYEQRAPQSQGQTAMPYDQPPRDPPLLEGIAGRMGNPLFQSGLGLFLSAAQGGDLNAGATSGMSRAKAMQDYYTQEQEQRQREIVKNGVRQWTNDDTIFGNVPPGLRAMTRLTGDPTAALNFMAKHPEMELERRKMQLAADKLQADIASGNKPQVVGTNLVQNTPEGVKVLFSGEDQSAQRLASIQAAGMDPNHPHSKVFIATGKYPKDDQQLTATDKKAILEAEEAVERNDGVIAKMKEAIKLSPKAYEGYTASPRGYIGSLLGLEGGKATENLNNIVTSGSLENLKAIFGGNPTEGERKILLDLQGSANKADSVRLEIYDRALKAAERRQEFNRRKAEELKGGTYYKPATAKPEAVPGAAASPAASAQADATPSAFPAPNAAHIDALRKDKSKAMRDFFDGKFGPGASDRALRGN